MPTFSVIVCDNCVPFRCNYKKYERWAIIEKVNPVIHSGLIDNALINLAHSLFLLLIII
jgi:hypothetical protein